MGGNPAKQGNAIAQASLNESKRQYDEQKRKEQRQKELAKANATGSRTSGNMAYSNNYTRPTDFSLNENGTGYNIMTAGGTESVIGSLLGTGIGTSDTLGG